MEFLGIIVIIIIFIAKTLGQETGKTQNPSNTQNPQNTVQRNNTYNSNNNNTYSRPVSSTGGASGEKDWEKAARENIERAARRAGQIANKALNDLFEEEGVTSPETEDMTAAERIRARRMEEKRTTILQRAKGNASENIEDVTLNTMEAEHNHSERVSAAEHHHPEDIIPDNMLGSVEDLMIKGYDGNLCFERDFVGEGLDMISRFTVPSDIPAFSSSEEAS
jgi:DNA polymerase III gamma/tau subunit